MDKNLVTRADFDGNQFKYLTINLNNNEIDAHISEAQRLDLRPFLGVELYHDMVSKYPDAGVYDDLVNGVEYEWCGNTIEYDGLKVVILYYAYARYLLNQDAVSTPFGVGSKTSEFTTPLSTKSLQMKVDSARSAANAYLLETERFLTEKSKDYPLWKCGVSKKRKGGANLSVVDKGDSRRNTSQQSTFVHSDRKPWQ
jgi:hypothetical protein